MRAMVEPLHVPELPDPQPWAGEIREQANQALSDLRDGRLQGAAVLVPDSAR